MHVKATYTYNLMYANYHQDKYTACKSIPTSDKLPVILSGDWVGGM